MKQIYFTFCQTNYSFQGYGGDRARAASSGISVAKMESVKPICGWSAPEKLLDYKQQERLQFAPKSLKYTEISGQKILVHSVYALPDEETNREGNYFSHVLLDFPQSWNARKALELWESPIWKTSDSRDIQKILPDLQDSDCIPGKINDQSFIDFLQDSWHTEIFHFLFQNWLVRKPNELIVLCCKPEEAAFCLWGLTRYLPQYFWDSLTFSTYEKPREFLSYNVTTFSTLGEVFQESEQILVSRMQKRWPKYRIFPTESPINEQEFPFITEWVQLIRNGEGQKILDFIQQVPARDYDNFETLELFWNFICHKEMISDLDFENALNIPELHPLAEKYILANGNFGLENLFHFLPQLTQEGQEVLLNRLLKEKTLAEIRSNPAYSQPLLYALSGRPQQLPSLQPTRPGKRKPFSTPQVVYQMRTSGAEPPVMPEKDNYGFLLILIFVIIVCFSFLVFINIFELL